MKILDKIKSESIISIDIETVRIEENYESLDERTKMAWEYKYKKEGIVPDEEELSVKWLESAALYAEFSKICAVSLSFIYKDILYCKEFYGNNEKEILKQLSVTLDNIYDKSEPSFQYRLLGHSSKFFDYPFLCKRYIVNDLNIPSILDSTDEKPWTQLNLCTNDLWKMGGMGAGSTLLALCNVLNIPSSKADLAGDEVGKCYYKNEFERISRYCSHDCIATFNIFRKFKKECIFEFEDVVYINGMNVVEVREEKTALQKLYQKDYLADDIKAELQEKLSKKRPSKKDKEFIQDILENVYNRTTFMAEDTKEIRESKKAEIQEFLKTI